MRWRLALALCAVAGMAQAQTDDRDYLTAFLEDNLSGAGRQVVITGFTGALSAQASIERLTIADDAGIWLTLDGVVLDWSRSALLSGEVVVNQLSAEAITLSRLPETPPEAPSPEATAFALPELPVSVDIQNLRADRIALGEDVLGQAVEARLDAALSLGGGAGEASLTLERIDDGPEGTLRLQASYTNATGALALDLAVQEEAGGIAARALGLPGAPAVALTLAGDGTLDDFAAEFRLDSDGQTRLSGPLRLAAAEDGARAFEARLAGDPAPLFLPEYAAFLGRSVAFDLTGTRFPSGRVVVDRLDLTAASVTLEGALSVAGDGLPEALDITARIADPGGAAVLLPLGGPDQTRVQSADLTLRLDGARDSGWTGSLVIAGLDRGGNRTALATLAGSGRIDRVGGRATLGATLDFGAFGLAMADAGLQQALGDQVAGQAILSWRQGGSGLSLSRFRLAGSGYEARAALTLAGLDRALEVAGRVELDATDLARFSALAGRPLGGATALRVEGSASALTGAFDADLQVTGQGLRAGIAQVDRLLSGPARIDARVTRDETGTSLQAFRAEARSLTVEATGKLTSRGGTVDGRLSVGDLSDLDPALGGSLSAAAGFDGDLSLAEITLDGQTRGLRTGQTEADRVLAGVLDLTIRAGVEGGVARLRDLVLTGPNLSATIEAQEQALRVAGRLRDLGLIAPDFPGAVSVAGTLTPRGSGFAADLRVQGPAGIDARIAGTAAPARADLTITGSANAAIANALVDPVTLAGALGFDLSLRGPWGPQALAGRVTLSDGRIGLPARGLGLQRVEVLATLTGGRAQLSATAEALAGGRLRVDGRVALVGASDLGLRLDGLRLRDPELFDTSVSGDLRLSGDLTGRAALSGRVTLGETELRVPSSGFSTAADLALIRHSGDSVEVRATRARALGDTAGGGAAGGGARGGPDWALDLIVSAPNRVFLRGRGLDAELGGEVRLTGTTSAVIPSGGLNLIRGRLDLLGKRLVISEAGLQLEGDFVPFVRVVASNDSEGIVSSIVIDGPANAPEVSFASTPELPEEEVLARLLFGRGLDTLSAFQALQLANAVAVLAGRGGEGIVARLRKGFGFDDLDISTDADGTASVSAGKYISENVYTEVGVDQDGQARINLNLDLRPGVTVKGRVDSDGDTGIGIFLERDY